MAGQAKSEYEIYLDFRAAEDLVSELRAIARETRNLAESDLGVVLSRVADCWTGDNASAFLEKGSILQQRVLSRAANLETIATTIEQMAKNTYEAEMEAVKIAQLQGQQ